MQAVRPQSTLSRMAALQQQSSRRSTGDYSDSQQEVNVLQMQYHRLESSIQQKCVPFRISGWHHFAHGVSCKFSSEDLQRIRVKFSSDSHITVAATGVAQVVCRQQSE